MSNLEQSIESAAAPQLKPDLDMTAFIARMPAPRARSNDGDAPMFRVAPTPEIPWG